eukprot:s255_g25.t1
MLGPRAAAKRANRVGDPRPGPCEACKVVGVMASGPKGEGMARGCRVGYGVEAGWANGERRLVDDARVGGGAVAGEAREGAWERGRARGGQGGGRPQAVRGAGARSRRGWTAVAGGARGKRAEPSQAGGARGAVTTHSHAVLSLFSTVAAVWQPRGEPLGDGLGQRNPGSNGQRRSWEGEGRMATAGRKPAGGVPVRWWAWEAAHVAGVTGLAGAFLARPHFRTASLATVCGLACSAGASRLAGLVGRAGPGVRRWWWGWRGRAWAGWCGRGAASARAGCAAAPPAPRILWLTVVFLKGVHSVAQGCVTRRLWRFWARGRGEDCGGVRGWGLCFGWFRVTVILVGAGPGYLVGFTGGCWGRAAGLRWDWGAGWGGGFQFADTPDGF